MTTVTITASPITVEMTNDGEINAHCDHRTDPEYLGRRRAPATYSAGDIAPLGGTIELVAQADSGPSAVTVALLHIRDVLVIDLDMPGMDGLGVVTAIMARWPGLGPSHPVASHGLTRPGLIGRSVGVDPLLSGPQAVT
ncbi:hypothetical protein [Dietzia maris]|uniref:hypothetical protein n=1 Tax=Dietzia maris TaxID=37915 RepID=UPI00223ADC70|nr:hypothetical protein [Dietzia maris]MCT1433501.1 hypothetical protein [Dietzia maris]MCT1520563.1 hypothetical protein [Dietzia maris]